MNYRISPRQGARSSYKPFAIRAILYPNRRILKDSIARSGVFFSCSPGCDLVSPTSFPPQLSSVLLSPHVLDCGRFPRADNFFFSLSPSFLPFRIPDCFRRCLQTSRKRAARRRSTATSFGRVLFPLFFYAAFGVNRRIDRITT